MLPPSRRSRSWRACWLGLGLTAACASSEVAAPEPLPEPAPAQAIEPAPPPAPPAAPPPGRDHRSAVACSTDAECGWDDPCQPRRCVEPPAPTECDKSSPAPGACLCVAGACTLKPDPPPPPAGTCEPRACVVDLAGGRCVADDGGVPQHIRATRPVDVGPSCDCPNPASGCTYSWFEPVPCETVRDCWVSPSPRRHPIARPKHLRKRDFKPCADGEAAPRCNEGTCVVGPAFSC